MKTRVFSDRHIGISETDLPHMLKTIGVDSLQMLIKQVIPENILLKKNLNLPPALSENEFLKHIYEISLTNKIYRSFIGQGWYNTKSLPVVQRNILENPVWYTSYTPYQAEISQGRLEALMNFQTMVAELTSMELSNCSLLDDASAAAEAMIMMFNLRSRDQIKNEINKLFIDNKLFEHIKAVIRTRAQGRNIEIVEGDFNKIDFNDKYFGIIIQYPNSDGAIVDYSSFVKKAHEANVKVAVCADILSLTLLVPPGEWDADICFGSTQRFGIPIYFGGPSAAFFATRNEYKRSVPGRIIGFSKDAYGKTALRMALQTREQHIKRDKATSNICTSQALMATMASFYAIYHGPQGLKNIASEIFEKTKFISDTLIDKGFILENECFFDTLKIDLNGLITSEEFKIRSEEKKINVFYYKDGQIGISIDETTSYNDINDILYLFDKSETQNNILKYKNSADSLPEFFIRKSSFLNQKVFNSYFSETEIMRYMKLLERRDISLTQSMIPLGSCTMKLNAASEMFALSYDGFTNIHPMAPSSQTKGYNYVITKLGEMLCEITGMASISFQPNSGAAGEYAGLKVIKAYHHDIGESQRNIVLIPASAHGTNPASAAMCGYSIIEVKCRENGDISLEDLEIKARENKDNLAALMITYPSTHGIFEENIIKYCDIIHDCGGQVYMDGANMNAQVGLTSPGIIGADVCHLNLHKTFAMPHGGGGPGEGPICVKKHLTKYLPHHPYTDNNSLNTVSASPFGNVGLLTISYGYILMMGAEGLKDASIYAILNANYLASLLKDNYGIVFTNHNKKVGHELILDCRELKRSSGIDENDIAKRIMDFGYHAPTLSFPVHETLMIEPTESESLSELNRFINVMNCIYSEIKEIENNVYPKDNNVLKNAPHPQYIICGDEWNFPYSRKKAAFALEYLEENKFMINVARIDNAWGDRNLIPTLKE